MSLRGPSWRKRGDRDSFSDCKKGSHVESQLLPTTATIYRHCIRCYASADSRADLSLSLYIYIYLFSRFFFFSSLLFSPFLALLAISFVADSITSRSWLASPEAGTADGRRQGDRGTRYPCISVIPARKPVFGIYRAPPCRPEMDLPAAGAQPPSLSPPPLFHSRGNDKNGNRRRGEEGSSFLRVAYPPRGRMRNCVLIRGGGEEEGRITMESGITKSGGRNVCHVDQVITRES